MEEKRKAIDGLGKLGVPLGEAKTYVALLENGPSEATPLAKFAEVPQPKIYSYLSDLEIRGLVTKLEMEGKPNLYNPIGFDFAIAQLKAELMENLSDTELALKSIQEQEKPNASVAYVSLSQGIKPVEKSLNNSLNSIKTRAIIFCGDSYDEILHECMLKKPEIEIIRPLRNLKENFDSLPPFIQNLLNSDLLRPLQRFRPMFILKDYCPETATCDSVIIASRDQTDEDSSIMVEITHPDITKLQTSIALILMQILESFIPDHN